MYFWIVSIADSNNDEASSGELPSANIPTLPQLGSAPKK